MSATGPHRAAAFFFGLLLAAGFGLGLHQAHSAGAGDFDARAWLNGTAGARLDTALHVPEQRRLETLDAAWRYRLLGQLGSQVREGCPGWLFYSDGLRAPVADVSAVVARRIALMHRLTARLRGSGVPVLVVTVPDKSRIVAGALCGLARPPATAAGLTQWQRALEAAGVTQVELASVLGRLDDPFYRTDVHLNQAGAEAAAQAVAAAALPMLGRKGDQHYTVSTAALPEPRAGDLLTLAGLAEAPAGWRPAPDLYVPQTLRPVTSGGLLDDGPPVEVLLAGSSNARRSNFAERLGFALGRPVWNASRDGGRFADALMQALQTRKQWPRSLKLVIWELSEMSLLQPLTDQEKAALESPADAGI